MQKYGSDVPREGQYGETNKHTVQEYGSDVLRECSMKKQTNAVQERQNIKKASRIK